jgi:hypothetical protein
MADTTKTHTSTPWEIIAQDGSHLIVHRAEDGSIRVIAHLLERKASLAEDLANGRLIITAVNAWSDADALRARLAVLEAA